jgi:hypothetical protein
MLISKTDAFRNFLGKKMILREQFFPPVLGTEPRDSQIVTRALALSHIPSSNRQYLKIIYTERCDHLICVITNREKRKRDIF